ncbi:TM2 domain-containing protein [Roseospirillum parvum]|uniref:TM2 domain-containing protein n=1 Tax=Roseospirillum parvum TaxID=83401 RepID=A0A1G8CNA3_9PROT|nr:TM2 domain-containing protein [Roseospirillum parvum]SDH46945.1 TM2 domain-containing protein [Roseospirillum parvum]
MADAAAPSSAAQPASGAPAAPTPGGLIHCATCGGQMAVTAAACPHCGAPNPAASMGVSDKGMVPAALLCFFLGSFGIHRFYVGKIVTGILMLLTLGAFGIWTLIDFVMILVGSFKDKNGLPLKR